MSGSLQQARAAGAQRLPAGVRAVVGGGLLAGTIDIGSACLINSLAPPVILHAIASGVLGAASFRDGMPAALAGLGLQWAMSLLIAGIYVAAASRWALLRRHSIGAGIAYGLVIYIVMNYVVVPLSAAPFAPPRQPIKMFENVLAMILFGLIVAAASQLAGVGGRAARRAAPGA